MNVSPFAITVVALGVVLSPFTARSAPPAIVDPSRRNEDVIPQTTPGLSDPASLARRSLTEDTAFAPNSGGDDDIGMQLILKKVPENNPFRFTSDAFLYYTNNAARTSSGEQGDSFFGWNVAASYQPRITNRLFADVGISEDWFRYDTLHALNFESMEVGASLLYALPELADSLVFAGYHYNRITHDFSSLLNTHSIRAGIQKTVLIDRRNSIALGLRGDFDFDSDVPAIKRNEYSADVGWKYKLMQNLQFSLGYHFTFFDYDQDGRHDNMHGLAFGVSYMPRKWCEVYLSATYTFNNSNFAVYEYEAANFGGGLGVRIKF